MPRETPGVNLPLHSNLGSLKAVRWATRTLYRRVHDEELLLIVVILPESMMILSFFKQLLTSTHFTKLADGIQKNNAGTTRQTAG